MRKTATVLAVVAQVVLLACLVSGTSSADTAIPGLGDILQPKPAPEPETLALSGTIRDFKQSHPDFEKFGGVDHGIVTGNLGPDRKPVYASSTRTPTTTGKQDFDQWYRDVPNVNLRTEYGIVLNRVSGSDPAIYHYVNPAFFPIDGKLWGNEGQPHNYWFTYELHNTFTYRGGEKFTFTGDDDVWV